MSKRRQASNCPYSLKKGLKVGGWISLMTSALAILAISWLIATGMLDSQAGVILLKRMLEILIVL